MEVDDRTSDDDTQMNYDGVLQYHVTVAESEKKSKLLELLRDMSFNQLILLVREPEKCDTVAQILKEKDVTSTSITVHHEMNEEDQKRLFQQFLDSENVILVSTALFGSRNNIPESVNIVLNYDSPEDVDSYLRILARAAKSDSGKLLLTLAIDENETSILKEVEKRLELSIAELPTEVIPDDNTSTTEDTPMDEDEILEQNENGETFETNTVETQNEDDEEEEVEDENEESIRSRTQFPTTRVKKIMKAALGEDDTVRIMSKESVFLVGHATELFIAALAQEASKITHSNRKKTMNIQHLITSITESESFSFLEGTMVPDYDF